MEKKVKNKAKKIEQKDLENKEKLKIEVKKEIEGKEEINLKDGKEIKNEANKEIFSNIIIAIILLAYFFIIQITCSRFMQNDIFEYLEIPATIFFLLGLFFFERSYKKDSGKIFLRGLEFVVISGHTLSIEYVVTKYNFDIQLYLTVSSYVFAIYYVLKSIIIYTKMRKEYLKSLSDISDIVREDKPLKKEAIKKKNNNIKENVKTEEAKKDKNKDANKDMSVSEENQIIEEIADIDEKPTIKNTKPKKEKINEEEPKEEKAKKTTSTGTKKTATKRTTSTTAKKSTTKKSTGTGTKKSTTKKSTAKKSTNAGTKNSTAKKSTNSTTKKSTTSTKKTVAQKETKGDKELATKKPTTKKSNKTKKEVNSDD